MDRLVTILLSGANVFSIAVSGDRVLTGLGPDDQGVDLWSLRSGTVTRHFGGLRNQAVSVALSPDGRMVAASSDSAAAVAWNIETGAMVKQVPAPGPSGDQNSRIAISSDGQVIVSCCSGLIMVFDTALTQKLKFKVFEVGVATLGFAIAPGGAQAAVGYDSTAGNDIKIFDLVSGQMTLGITAHHGGGVTDLAWSSEGLLSGGGNGTLSLSRPTDGALIRAFTGHTGIIRSVAIDTGGRLAASGGFESSAVTIWDVATGAQVASLDHGTGVNGLAFTSDGKSVLSIGGKNVKVWNVSDLGS